MTDRARERAIRALTRKVSLITERDRLWFEQHPWRSYRLRPADDLEIDLFAVTNQLHDRPDGFFHCVAVRQVRPGYRFRLPWMAMDGTDVDYDEDGSRYVYSVLGEGALVSIGATL